MNYQISASKLDKFCKIGKLPYVGAETEYTVEDLIRDLETPFVETEAMRRGTAFHSLISNPALHRLDYVTYQCDGFTFVSEKIETYLERFSEFKTFELFNEKTFSAADYQSSDTITVRGIADAIHGNEIHEFKTTSNFNYDNYYSSWQWRVYLWLFELKVFRYHVFELSSKDKISSIKKYLPLTQYYYKDLESQIQEKCREFVALLKILNKEHLLYGQNRPNR